MATVVNHTDQELNLRGPVTDVFLTAGATWASIPAALTEFNGATSARVRKDLRPYSKVRLSANVGATAGPAGCILQLQYSLDNGATWAYVDGLLTTSGGPQVSIATTATTAAGPWVAITALAKSAQVLLRLVGLTGDGSTSPVIGAVHAEFSA
ncbi:MAG TPA: hypothetical protein VNM39_11980 [Verrucomicrobiae bacterium]|nr:hypothetical protein [Verrucomicrobiae bacterium]